MWDTARAQDLAGKKEGKFVPSEGHVAQINVIKTYYPWMYPSLFKSSSWNTGLLDSMGRIERKRTG